MARAVGDSNTYPVHLVNLAGEPIGRPFELPSVSTILKALPKGGLDWHGWRLGIHEGRKVGRAEGREVEFADGAPPEDDGEFYEWMKAKGRAGLAVTPRNFLDKAADRGSEVHDIAETYFTDGSLPDPDTLDPLLHGYVHAFARWVKKYIDPMEYEVIARETSLFSLRHGYAGTNDLILKQTVAVGPPIFHVIDFKTAGAHRKTLDIYESNLLQACAYAYAAIEQGYVPDGAAVNLFVVRFGANGKFATKSHFFGEPPYTIDAFLAVKQVYEWLLTTGWKP